VIYGKAEMLVKSTSNIQPNVRKEDKNSSFEVLEVIGGTPILLRR